MNPSRRRWSNWECPACGTHEPPEMRTKTTRTGWICFWCFIWVFPFNFLFLLVREERRYCSDCGRVV